MQLINSAVSAAYEFSSAFAPNRLIRLDFYPMGGELTVHFHVPALALKVGGKGNSYHLVSADAGAGSFTARLRHWGGDSERLIPSPWLSDPRRHKSWS